jgi:hypothetical protein
MSEDALRACRQGRQTRSERKMTCPEKAPEHDHQDLIQI